MAYWTLQLNPNHFQTGLDDGYGEGEDDWWRISLKSKIAEGDIAFIWKSMTAGILRVLDPEAYMPRLQCCQCQATS